MSTHTNRPLYEYAIARERRDKIRTAIELLLFTFLILGGGLWLLDTIMAARSF